MTIKETAAEFFEEWSNSAYHVYDKKILVEGDSWVSHPQPDVTNLAEQLDNIAPFSHLILNIASPGDEAKEIFDSKGRQMKLLKSLIKSTQWGAKFDLILLSAAGNDIVGPEIIEFNYVRNKRLFPYLQGKELITPDFYAMVEGIVDGYRRFLKFLASTDLNRNVPVITHCYSFLTPRELGTHFCGKVFHKGWIQRYLKAQGIKDENEQYEIVCEMLDAFYRRTKVLENEFDNFLMADTRTVLSKGGKPNLDWWHDEIHPNPTGYKRVLKKIIADAKKVDLWPL